MAVRAFVSHSHEDKRIARRVVRFLVARGVDAWLDERELRIGAVLSTALREQIEGSDVVLVLASDAATTSEWVAAELDDARGHGVAIVPLLIEPVAEHPLFRDHFGLDATARWGFAAALDRLVADIWSGEGEQAPQPDPKLLEQGLAELARQEPDIAPLVDAAMVDAVPYEILQAATRAPFHVLDEAIDTLLAVHPTDSTAYTAAGAFCRAGAGMQALEAWIAATGDGGGALTSAVGDTLDPSIVPAALELLGKCSPPNDHALYMFIDRNAASLDAQQREAAIRLTLWPTRADPSGLADVLAFVALQHFRESRELCETWVRWIRAGFFDGDPRVLAHWSVRAGEESIDDWSRVSEALRSYVRGQLRSGDRLQVDAALGHIQAAADEGSPVLDTLLREANGVSATAEWDDWRERDPENAEWMGWYVHCVTEEARGDRNWLRALQKTERLVEFEKRRQEILRGLPDASA